MFKGTYTALVTPFRDGRFDEDAFARLIEDQIAGGVDGIVPVGTTGESPTVDLDEHIRVIELAVQVAAKRVTVIAGTGSNATAEAVNLSEGAVEKGADALLLVNPYYNKPSQEGLFRHYKTVADSVPVPIMLYSVPGRTCGEIAVETVVRLAANVPNIVSIKEAGGSVDRVGQLVGAVPENFTILSGDDSLTLPFLSVGAVGVVSVASNVVPKAVADLVKAFRAGDLASAQALHKKYLPLFKDLFIEANPVPAKAILSWLGKMSAEVRLPLCELSPVSEAKLRKTATEVGIL
ncbi:MAG TPA: 4-hydroxy-tetrahydrodipicolinate synthase [Chthoniobacterales bacterium]